MTVNVLQEDMVADRINAWKERLQSLTELQLPTDYPRSIPLKIVEAVEALQLPEATCLAILQLSLAIKVNSNNAQLEHPSPFSILLAAFAVLLHRYTGEEDIPVGSSSDSRNPLVLRLTIKGTDTFEDVVQMVQKVEEQAAKIEIPFGTLLSQLYQDQDNSSNPLFKVRFFNQTDIDSHTITETTSTNDLTIFITSSSTSLRRLIPGIEVKVSYNQVLFSPSRIQHILDQLVLVLESAAADKSVQVGIMNLITERCRDVIPDPTADLNWCQWEGAITDIFARNANSFPDRTCIVESVLESSSNSGLTQMTRVRRFTYEHIYKAANTVAHYLVQNGLEREDVVMIYAYRGVDLVVAIMGTLMAGGTFSVIDPAYPPARQQIYLSVAQPKALVVLKHAGNLHTSVREYIDTELSIKCEIPALELFDDGELSGGGSHGDGGDILEHVRDFASTPLDIILGPDSIGTLSFTSGSTGIPKGVRGRHFSLTHFYPWMSQEFSLSDKEHFTMLSGIAHDPIQRDIFTPLFLGAELHIPTSEDIGIPGRLAEWMAEHEISVTHLTPAMGQLLSANATTPIPSLRNSFFVGDILTKRDCNRLQHLAPNATIINMYGTTETQRAVSYFAIPPRATHPSFLTSTKDIMPAGRGMRSVQLLVVNRIGKGLCGVGEVGEIYVRSGGLSEGYLKLEEVTNEKFLTNWFGSPALHNGNSDLPFFKGPRDRMYRTGDLGRYKPDGCVECTGRADDQIKIRGFRIELGEIDTHLSQHPLVRENVTLVRRDKNEEQTLVSYFVPMENAEGFSTDEEAVSSGQPRKYTRLIRDIREWLKKKLPSYSVPSVFVPLKKMPLTPNGKVDKPALPFPDTVQTASLAQAGNSTLDLTPTQKLIHDIWRSILNQASISIDDNFFDIGGHSILATRMIFDVRKKCGVDVPLGLVFREPTIRGMSKEVEAIKNDDLNLPDNCDVSPDQPSNEDKQTVNYAHDFDELVKLLPSYAPVPQFPVQENSITHFFLTGATGFLGAFVLAEILRVLPNAKVYCLVRCKDEVTGFERIKKNCEAHLVWKDSWSQPGNEKVFAVKGDLNMENLGISKEKWTELTKTVDIIIHNGALVHWVYPYQKLRPANVIGTLETLRLASEYKTKSLHFVSSTSVLDSDHYIQLSTTGTPVSEDDDLEGSRTGLQTGYGQSKWVSEKLIMEARKRGLPATIIRPGYVVGDSEIGVTNTDDFLWRLVKGCIQLGEVPIMNNIVNMCPVDYVAGTVVAVATQEKCLQRVAYHTTNPHRFRFNDMFASLMQYGFNVKPVEYILWRNHLMDVTLSANSDNALYPLLHFVLDDLPTSSKSPELDDTNTTWSISGTSVKCAPMDTLMGLYLAYLIKVGFLELPELPQDQKSKYKTLPVLKKDVTMISRSGN